MNQLTKPKEDHMHHGKIIYNNTFNSMPIYQKGNGSRVALLKRWESLLTYAIYSHSSIFFVRFDVHFSADIIPPGDNEIFEEFIAYLIKIEKRKGFDPLYLWRREQGDPPKYWKHFQQSRYHYHVILLLNGDRAKGLMNILQLVEIIWWRMLKKYYGGAIDISGLIDYCLIKDKEAKETHDLLDNGTKLCRTDDNFSVMFNKLFKWGSYLAKVGEDVPVGIRSFGASEIPS